MSERSKADFLTAEAEYQHLVKVAHQFDFFASIAIPCLMLFACIQFMRWAWSQRSNQ